MNAQALPKLALRPFLPADTALLVKSSATALRI